MSVKISFFILLSFVIIACKPSFEEPIISLESYKIEEGFELKVVASEPLLGSPVAIDFDTKGRIWVAEMTGFMRDIDGSGENEPTGSIKILEDLDHDGVMDHQKPFLENLVMPRALALVYGGLLYAEPPNLWFVYIDNDKPVNRVLVDSLYAPEGNPEHQPNGLKLNIDNWIYNANSTIRYQKKEGVWIKEPTHFRGQWGITHDNFGRLYSNSNSVQISGDYVLPNRSIRNQYYKPKSSNYKPLTTNQRVYPLHPTLVNRGYAAGQLTKDSLVKNVTSACGPLIYRGDVFPEDYIENAFVCVPEGNVVKRNILAFKGDSISATQAWNDKEFLASTDEGFRPVNLSNSPDGSMHIVDMHRGVIQHITYLSPYLREKAQEKKLDTMINFGRILKVESKDQKALDIPDLSTFSGNELVEVLKSENGWLRDRAQHFLIYKKQSEAIPALKLLAGNTKFPWSQIHALYALKGLEALTAPLLNNVAKVSNAEVSAHAIVLLDAFVSKEYVALVHKLFSELMSRKDKGIDLYLSGSIGLWQQVSPKGFDGLLKELLNTYKNNPVFNDAFLSGFGTLSNNQLTDVNAHIEKENTVLSSLILATLKNKEKDKKNGIFAMKPRSADPRTKGAKLFRQLCAACHGIGGEGIEGLAPPLLDSEYTKKPESIGLIVLHGVKGPIHVNGNLYNMNNIMPGFMNNPAISDSDIADVVAYVTSAFSDSPRKIDSEEIKKLRDRTPKSGSEYTEDELQAFINGLD